jgi:hypothetical protein
MLCIPWAGQRIDEASRKEVTATLITKARKFRFCGASDDPDEITAVTSGYMHLIIGFKRLVGPLLPEPAASQLNAIDVEIDNIYSAYEARAELDALLPDIEDALDLLNNEEWASIIGGSATSAGLVRSEADTTRIAIAEALGHTDYLQKIDEQEFLKTIGDFVGEALTERSAPSDVSTFEVRGEPETRNWIGDRVKGVISGIDKLVGKLAEDHLGVLNQRLRVSLMNGVAATLGDIVAYHSNKKGIQQRLWDAVNQYVPGYGKQAKPIGLIAHSLGGVVSFDAAVAPANGIPLYVDSFVSFGSQPAFFEIIDPRVSGVTYRANHPIRLPDTIKKWFNLWNVVDLLAFTAGTVFRLSDGSKPEDVPVEDPISVMLDENLWLHSIYWTTPQLKDVFMKAFQ